MKAWISANGGQLALVVLGVSVGGFQSNLAGLALICFGVAWWMAARVRLIGRYLPRVRTTWVPADAGWLRRRRPENLEERAVRLAHAEQITDTPEAQQAGAPAKAATVLRPKQGESATPARAPARAPAPAAPVATMTAERESAQALLMAGHQLMDDLLKARRQRTSHPLGLNPAVSAVARQTREWNERVAEAVDASPLSFNTKISLALYQEQPLLSAFGASPERVAAVIDNNMALLGQVVRAYSHG